VGVIGDGVLVVPCDEVESKRSSCGVGLGEYAGEAKLLYCEDSESSRDICVE